MDFSSLPYELQFSYLLDLPLSAIASYCRSNKYASAICSDDGFWKYKVDQDSGLGIYKPEGITYRQQYMDLMNLPSLENSIKNRRLDLVIQNIHNWNFPRAKEAKLADELGYTEIRDYLISRGVIYYTGQEFSISKSLDDVRFAIEQLPSGVYDLMSLNHVFNLDIDDIKLMMNRYMSPEDRLLIPNIGIHTELVLSRPGPKITYLNPIEDEYRNSMSIKNGRCFRLFTDIMEDFDKGRIINYKVATDQSGVSSGLTRLNLQLKLSPDLPLSICETIVKLVPDTDKILPPW